VATVVGSRPAVGRFGLVGLVAVVASGAAVAGVFACRQAIGIDQYYNAPADAGASTSACGLPYGTSACASCVRTRCCAESSACAADPVCAPRLQCHGRCAIGGEQFRPCLAQCDLDHPGTSAPANALQACSVSQCEAECGLTCGLLGPNIPLDAAAGCQACIVADTNACAFNRACSSSVECIDWASCLGSCSTPDCQATCDALYNAGSSTSPLEAGTLLASAGSVYGGTCKGPCVSGSSWACVGHVVWPSPTAGSTTLTGRVLDFATNQPPLSAVDVSICLYTDNGCMGPLGRATTDGKGNWQAPLAGQAANGLQDIFAQLASPVGAAPAYVPELKFIGYPVSEPVAPINASQGINFVATLSEYQDVLSPAGVTWDTSKGWVGFSAYDCGLAQASGVTVALIGVTDRLVRPYYFRGRSYDFTAAATDASGQGGFVNVPPGQYVLAATVEGQTAPYSTGHVFVRAGARSLLHMYPTP
jgi:hypothetical protein